MLTRVRAVPVAEYEAWVSRTRLAIKKSQAALSATRRERGEFPGLGGARCRWCGPIALRATPALPGGGTQAAARPAIRPATLSLIYYAAA